MPPSVLGDSDYLEACLQGVTVKLTGHLFNEGRVRLSTGHWNLDVTLMEVIPTRNGSVSPRNPEDMAILPGEDLLQMSDVSTEILGSDTESISQTAPQSNRPISDSDNDSYTVEHWPSLRIPRLAADPAQQETFSGEGAAGNLVLDEELATIDVTINCETCRNSVALRQRAWVYVNCACVR
jgi:hypothetical protein